MPKNRTTLWISLIMGVCGGLALLTFAHFSGEKISFNALTQDALVILVGTIVGCFCTTFILLKLLFRTNITRKFLLLPLVAIVLFGYYSFESGSFYFWQKALLIKDNPYDGIYSFDPSRINTDAIKYSVERGQKLGAQPLTLIIDQNMASLYGYQWNAPAISRLFNICFKGDVMQLVNGDWADGYCQLEEQGNLILSFKAEGKGRLFVQTVKRYCFHPIGPTWENPPPVTIKTK